MCECGAVTKKKLVGVKISHELNKVIKIPSS